MKRTTGVKFSDTLREWRRRQGLTQRAAAELLGNSLRANVGIETFRAWEQGKNEPRGIARAALDAVMVDTDPRLADSAE